MHKITTDLHLWGYEKALNEYLPSISLRLNQNRTCTCSGLIIYISKTSLNLVSS